MKKANRSYTLLNASKHAKPLSNSDLIRQEPPAHRLKEFDPEKIALDKRKKRKSMQKSATQLENSSGEALDAAVGRLRARGGARWGGFEGRGGGSVRPFY